MRPRPLQRRVVRQTAKRFGAVACTLVALQGCEDPATRNPGPSIVVDDPYRRGGSWYKANFHLHSTHSHGLMSAAELAQLYHQNGYAAICITDHNQYGDQDGGLLSRLFQCDSVLHDWNEDGRVHPDSVYGSGVEAYVRDWTVEPPAYRKDRWFRPPTASTADVPLVLSGFEASYGYFGAHFGLVGFPPGAIDPPRPGFEWLVRSRAVGGFAYIAHPADANDIATRFAAGMPLSEFHGLEILNGVRLTGGERADATPLWDSLLTRGHELWGLANDDAHQPPGSAEQFPFVAFDMLLSTDLTAPGVLDALHQGSFYASTGLLFEELRLDGPDLHVRVPGALRIRFVSAGGQVAHEVHADNAVYSIRGTEGYVRVEACGDSVTAPRASWVRSAWSQPFRVSISGR